MGESVAEATITRLKEVGDRIEADEAVQIATDKVDSEVLVRFQVFSRTVIWWMS
jgi:pyruvate/2-oxoglutarate dehydrogenase complex dihydrolipoamide acyltransferase (E2) component